MKLYLFFFLTLVIHLTIAQTAQVKVNSKRFGDDFEKFDELVFTFNGVPLKATDTLVKEIPLHQKGFDQCTAVIGKDTLRFLAKFKANQLYSIRAGCCCAVFTLQADHDPKRGSVRFINKSSADVLMILSESNSERVNAKTTSPYVFAGESAMCFFKPSSILLTETIYGDSTYDYHDDPSFNHDSLWAEQKTHLIASTWFHFLHGEKLSMRYDKESKQLTFKLDGYLNEEEYKHIWD